MTPELIKKYRVQATGKRGLIITIPSKFSLKNDLEAGDQVEVYKVKEDKGLLLLRVTGK